MIIIKFYLQLDMAHKLNPLTKSRDTSEPKNYRLSMPTFQTSPFRSSLTSKCQPKQYFRASDMSGLPNLQNLSKRETQKKVQFSENQKYPKSSTNLLSTLRFLESKLDQAKNQLKSSKSKSLSGFRTDLNMVKQCGQSDQISLDSSLFEKTEQSTFNLQSHSKLISVVKSKQNLLLMTTIKSYYVAQIAQGFAGFNERALQHFLLSHQVLRNVQASNFLQYSFEPAKHVYLPVKKENMDKKVLVLDLDEALIHYQEIRKSPQDIQVNIPTENKPFKAYISLRPYTLSFLKKARKNFQIIVFTASQQTYADAILDQIDPENNLIDHRLYRQHCMNILNKLYTKDLSIINRDLSKMVLVDNSPFSYLCQIQNGIPILSYNGGADSELLKLQKYLDLLIKEKDVRSLNFRTFKLNRYGEYTNCQQLIKELYCNQHDYS